MRFVSLIAAVLISLTLVASPGAWAADAAQCSGVVKDENGVPVAGAQVKVVISQDAGTNTYQTQTDSAGRFSLRDLPAGLYELEARKEGFFVFSEKSLKLDAGPNEVTLTLNHEEEVHEQVQVTASANQIDPEDTAQRSALTARDIRDIPMPNSHILAESLLALPEIVRDHSNNLHIAGARSGEAQYLLDGFEIGDPVNGALTSRFNIDATRAAEVQTGRFGAAYAHSGAGILSLDTPDGDDRWRFGTTNPAPGVNIQERAHLGNWYPRFNVSGPIERGRFWFSDSISVQHTFDVVKGLPSNANTSEEWAGDDLLRLQYNINAKHILHASYLYNRAHDEHLGLDALDPQTTTVTAEQRRGFVSLKDQIWLHDALAELGVAADSGTLDYTPQGAQPFLLLIDGTGGNYFARTHQRGRRLQAVGSVTAGSRRWYGTHELSVGFNVAGLAYTLFAQRGEIQALRALDISGKSCVPPQPGSPPASGCLVRQTTFSGPAVPRLSNTQAGGYAQDNWSISKRFIFQAGLRTDWDRFTQSALAEPRVSGNVLPFGDDRAKFSLGWGIYNAPLNLSVIGQGFDQRQVDMFFDTAGNSTGTATSQFVLPSGGLKQPRFAISSAGWQEKFGKKTLAGVELLARNGSHQFAYVDQQPTQPGGVFLLQDHREDRYRAVTFSIRQVFSESMQVYGAYTRSRAHSNEVLNPAHGSIFYAAQQPGPVAWDAPNRLVSWGWAPTRIWKIQLSYFFEYRTGYPFSVVNLQQQLVGAPNSSRFPAYASLNLGIEKKFGFRGYLWGVRIEGVNILGRQNPDTVVNNIDAPKCTSALSQGCFGAFSGGQGRATTLRVRLIGRK